MATNKGSWGSLPNEIRLMILETLLQDGCSLASLATVSREWQTIMEEHNFARIKVTLSRLRVFGPMLHRNRALVRYIWLCVELAEYGCMDCESIGLEEYARSYGAVVCECVFHNLFSVLSTWEPHGSLLLDISFHSPSDPEHWFPGLTSLPDIPSFEEFELAVCGKSKPKVAAPKDNKHGWADGSPSLQALYKITEDVKIETVDKGRCPLEDIDDRSRRMPVAPAVTGFLLRQQNYRQLNPRQVGRMFEVCTGLQDVYYEPWRQCDDSSQFEVDLRYMSLFHPPLPDQVRKFVLFENFDERIPLENDLTYYSTRIPSRIVSMGVASNSRTLEHFSAAFIVNATTFLEACRTDWTWPKLKTIALTLPLLLPEEHTDEGELAQVLKAAAAAAEAMPNLETMEIWNGGVGFAGMFRYRSARRGRAAGITWKGTWDLALKKDVIQAWEAVRRKEEDAMYGYRRSQLVVSKEVLHAYIRFHGDAIHYLGLEAEVMRPVSLYQMRMERDIGDKNRKERRSWWEGLYL